MNNNKWLNVLPCTPPVIILGMHRSGTSLLTSILAKCGIYLGKDLDRNHESKTFKGLNEFLINSMGGNWDYPSPVKVLEKDHNLRIIYLKYLRGQIESPRCVGYLGWKGMLKSKPVHWGWKDPRNSFTLGIWSELYPDCKAILIERHGLDVALSLAKRRDEYLEQNKRKLTRRSTLYSLMGKRGTFVDTPRCWSVVEGVKLWSEYTLKARQESSRLLENRHLLLRFEDFLVEPTTHIKKILDFVAIDYNEKALGEICLKVNPKKAFAYRHSDVLKRLSPAEQKTIEALLAPIGYTL